ncbi:cation:proton antiporter [Mucilaginibacter sp. BT774]|uniref:cation:proton antiporter domain-containing protein n=1 Tax=Mucilaginibacter sp. BT774 TaxID=3062276 RepID=UPI002676CAD0|nr:cation:proton antiporter [Mucilaginibacter sp. BT774]MDO3627239.1 cation:proton antiporter [Mucilaginibacter sp. BT774]
MTTYTTLIILSALVIFSYLFDLLAGKTKIPSVLLLLFLGIIIKQTVDYFNFKTFDFTKILPALGTLGLILIVFEGSLELKYSKEKNAIIKKTFFSALIILLLTCASITFVINYLTGQNIYLCFVNSIPFCVVSSAIAIPSSAGISKSKREFIIYESSFSDILAIILFNFAISNTQFDVSAFTGLGIELIIILLFAAVSCVCLLYLIGRIKHHIKFFLIISLITLVYAIGQSYHLSALIVVLSLGLFLNNAGQIRLPWFRRFFLYPTYAFELKQLLQLSGESAFVMRTFFFVLFGYSMDIYQLGNVSILISGGAILLAIYLIRFLYIKLVSKIEMMPELVLVPRGLISVLLYYNLPKELKIKGVETGLLFVVILGTSIIMSLGLLASKREKHTEAHPDIT